MGEQRQFNLSPSEAEECRADKDGRPVASGAEPETNQYIKIEAAPEVANTAGAKKIPLCCVGVVPGVGSAHSADCPHFGSPERSGREYVAGERLLPPRRFAGSVNFPHDSARDEAPHRPIFLKTPEQTCCAGVDVPGIGLTHAEECPAMARRAQLPEALADFVSEPPCRQVPGVFGAEIREHVAEIGAALTAETPQEQREKLLGELIFAALDLARQNLGTAVAAFRLFHRDERQACHECQMVEIGGALTHAPTCRTGRVLRIVATLLDTSNSNPNGKEAAADGETALVGDGIRRPGLKRRVCLMCGTSGGAWDARQVLEGDVDLASLLLNQCVEIDSKGYTLYTHSCKSFLRDQGGAL